ncbi:Phosphate-specific transport system accessory protein PhoU [Thalassocella blandensis]|nr:Phosphate-specific transport system accessory protein PhoU [Thalassocella blandensis]
MDTLQLDQHISQQFNADLEHLKTALLEMGGLVEEQLADVIKAIESGDSSLAEKALIAEDEIDRRELSIDKECLTVLARRQPAASDLRLVMMVSKAIRDLERMGDEASKIARMVIALSEDGTEIRGNSELRHLANSVVKIVRVALDAFAHSDVFEAIKVVKDDKEIDKEYQSTMREMITYMMEDPRQISRVMNVLWMLRSLERIGDHARNVAEQVIYLVRGMDIRRTDLSDVERQLESKS